MIMAFLALALVAVVHELGHLVAARPGGVEVEEFGIGLLPRLCVMERGGMVYSLDAILLGTFVRVRGELDPAVPGGLAAAPWCVRPAVFAAGLCANIALAFILSVLGALMEAGEFTRALAAGAEQTGVAVLVLLFLPLLLGEGLIPFCDARPVGPVGLAGLFSSAQGASALLRLAAMVSCCVGMINLLVPLPVLDGGQIALLILERLRRRRLHPDTMKALVGASLALVLGLAAVVAAADIAALR